MVDNKKAAQVASTGTAPKTAFNGIHSTKPDPLLGWHSLAASVKPSRNERQSKRVWLKGGRK